MNDLSLESSLRGCVCGCEWNFCIPDADSGPYSLSIVNSAQMAISKLTCKPSKEMTHMQPHFRYRGTVSTTGPIKLHTFFHTLQKILIINFGNYLLLWSLQSCGLSLDTKWKRGCDLPNVVRLVQSAERTPNSGVLSLSSRHVLVFLKTTVSYRKGPWRNVNVGSWKYGVTCVKMLNQGLPCVRKLV